MPTSKQIEARLPKGTKVYGNISYHNDTLKKHLLDIYLPVDAKEKVPLVSFIHGGGWVGNDKYAEFPAILQDCNKAVSFLYDKADKYRLDKNRIAIMGFSAGGHLASLMGTSQNNKVSNLYFPNTYRRPHYLH